MIEDYFKGCLYFAVSSLNRTVNRLAEEAFISTGLSPNYAFLLMLVNEKNGISQKEICNHLNLMPSTVSRFIDKLEAKGLIKRRVDGKNAFIYLTKQGSDLQPEIEKAWEILYNRYSEILGFAEGDALTSLIYEASKTLENK
ncbi:MAG: MarR family transcriptional regulator [Syntrophomonadaceae bacterium]